MVLVQDLESSDQNYLFFPGFWRAATCVSHRKGRTSYTVPSAYGINTSPLFRSMFVLGFRAGQ